MPDDDDKLAPILEAHAALAAAGTPTRFPDDFKQAVVAYVRPLRQAGATWSSAAQRLPVSVTTVRKWCVRSEQRQQPMRLVPVKVVHEPSVVDGHVAIDGHQAALCLTSPGGFRLTGISLQDARSLLESLP